MQFKPGFRLSAIDIIFIAIAILFCIYFFNIAKSISYIIGIVVGHFFLFCNIARMSRTPEIIWAVFFTLFTILSLKFNLVPLSLVFLASIVLSIMLVFLETRKPSYHGILWQKLNPNLENWFTNNNSK